MILMRERILHLDNDSKHFLEVDIFPGRVRNANDERVSICWHVVSVWDTVITFSVLLHVVSYRRQIFKKITVL